MAEFSIILDSCLVCDGRRVEPTDLVDIYLDTTKFPTAENPIRAVVLDVREPVPPESILGKVALDVQVADEDLPVGVTILEPDDIEFVKCVDCCVRNTERIEALEEKIVGTQETGETPFPPYVPSTFSFSDGGAPVNLVAYSGLYGGYPYFTVGTHTIRREGESWVWINSGTAITYTQEGEAGYLPWLGTSPTWASPGEDDVTITFSNYIPSTTPIPPDQIHPDMQSDDLLFVSTPQDEIYFWNGTTWEEILNQYSWAPGLDPSANNVPRNTRTLVIADTAGYSTAAGGIHVYAGDMFIRNPNPVGIPTLIRIGVSGIFRDIGVTTIDTQVIVAPKTWTALQTFALVDINGGNIDGTPIGVTTPSTGDFTNLKADSLVVEGGVFPAPNYGTVKINRGSNSATLIPASGISGNRTQNLPDRDGTVVVSQLSPTGALPFFEVGGIRMGTISMVAGSASSSISGGNSSSHIIGIVTNEQSGTAGTIKAFMSSSTLYVQSDSVTDTRDLSYTIYV